MAGAADANWAADHNGHKPYDAVQGGTDKNKNPLYSAAAIKATITNPADWIRRSEPAISPLAERKRPRPLTRSWCSTGQRRRTGKCRLARSRPVPTLTERHSTSAAADTTAEFNPVS